MKAPHLPLFFLALATVFASCDAVTGPEPATGGASEAHASLRHSALEVPAPSWGPRGVAICHLDPDGDYRRVVVAPRTVESHLRHGDERAGGDTLDGNCEPVQPVEACPCYSAESLGEAFGDAPPQPYLFFDVFSFWSEDPRRTEARATMSTEFGEFEEVAAVYITPTGAPDAPLAPLCTRQDVVADPVTGEPTYAYETLSVSIAEAEGCRRALYAFAEDDQTCEGAACGIPYSDEQLDPDYPPYHDDGFRTPDSVLDAMRARIANVQQRLALPA